MRKNVLPLVICLLSACGGSKVLKESEPVAVTQSLATASDERLAAALDWVIVRDGPGAWATNVDWDEYLIRVQNLTDEPIRVTNIAVFDSLDTRIEVGGSRRQLVEGTKMTKRRHKDEGLKVKAGANAGTLVATGGLVVVAGAVVGYSALAGSAGALAASSAAAASLVLLAPALIFGGVVRGMNNSAVDKQIMSRQTLLPVVLREAQGQNLNLFFPLAPSPRKIEFTYVDSQGRHNLIIDTQAVLDGLHLVTVVN